jgi:hypothetical protein
MLISAQRDLIWKVLGKNPEQASPTGVRQRKQNILDAKMPHWNVGF